MDVINCPGFEVWNNGSLKYRRFLMNFEAYDFHQLLGTADEMCARQYEEASWHFVLTSLHREQKFPVSKFRLLVWCTQNSFLFWSSKQQSTRPYGVFAVHHVTESVWADSGSRGRPHVLNCQLLRHSEKIRHRALSLTLWPWKWTFK